MAGGEYRSLLQAAPGTSRAAFAPTLDIVRARMLVSRQRIPVVVVPERVTERQAGSREE